MRLNVAYACNEAYVNHTGISMLSLFESNKDIEEISVYLIDRGIKRESKVVLAGQAEKYKRKLIFIPFETICSKLQINAIGRHIDTIYAKLFFSQLEVEDKILYLDSDTIVVDSLRGLWELDMADNLVAGVQTIASAELKHLVGMQPDDKFINDGIVLINLKSWRENGIEERFLDFIARFWGAPPVHSEGTINGVCKGKILVLNPGYNLMSGLLFFSVKQIEKLSGSAFYSQEEMDEAKSHPYIIHYLSAFYNRPWNVNCTHPYKDKYLYYKIISPWANSPQTFAKMPLRLKLIRFAYCFLPFPIFLLMQKLSNKKA